MSHRVAGAPLDFAALRSGLEVPGDFASGVMADARRSVAALVLPDDDSTAIPLVTVDPPGSRDLDQAVHIARDGDGFLVTYAIADVASFVAPDGPLDVETHRRGETLYFPDLRVPLHPPLLSEGAASLLPDEVRPAVLWQIGLAADGSVISIDVRRSRVRSVAQLDYLEVQESLERHTLPEALEPLADVGNRRLALARQRHAVDLDLPEQVVAPGGPNGWTLGLRAELPVERFNAEISLLTGMCAATLMLQAGVGVLRTVPPPDARAVAGLKTAAAALGIDWPAGAHPGDVLERVDRHDPHHVAFIEHAAALLRGAAYTVFDGAPPDQPLHSGIGAPYAHATAPLRRLVDRYVSEICLAQSAGTPVPGWVRAALPALPAAMAAADRRGHAVDRAVVDAAEAWLLQNRVGQLFCAVVIDVDENAATVVLDEPAVRARCAGRNLPLGERIRVRLITADVSRREVRFERVADSDA